MSAPLLFSDEIRNAPSVRCLIGFGAVFFSFLTTADTPSSPLSELSAFLFLAFFCLLDFLKKTQTGFSLVSVVCASSESAITVSLSFPVSSRVAPRSGRLATSACVCVWSCRIVIVSVRGCSCLCICVSVYTCLYVYVNTFPTWYTCSYLITTLCCKMTRQHVGSTPRCAVTNRMNAGVDESELGRRPLEDQWIHFLKFQLLILRSGAFLSGIYEKQDHWNIWHKLSHQKVRSPNL